MTIKDIVKITATFLGKENVLTYLSGGNDYGGAEKEVDLITRCANLIINETAMSYVPLIKEESVNAESGYFLFSELTETPFEILNVKDSQGNDVYYSVKTDRLEGVYGNVVVEYRYIPSNFGLNDLIGYTEKQIPARVLSYGVSAEVTLSEHSFNESVMWRKRFTDSLSEMIKPKNANIKSRRWA